MTGTRDRSAMKRMSPGPPRGMQFVDLEQAFTESPLAEHGVPGKRLFQEHVHFTFAGDFHPQMKQTRLDPPKRVEWRCVGGHANWQDNTFSFTLNERKGETLVQFVQEYAQELSDEVYGIYNFNWGYYLNSLKMLCEKGTGAPFRGA